MATPNLTHPIPNITNGTVDVLIYSNQVTNNFFAPTMILVLFTILFVGMKTRGIKTEHAFVSSSFAVTTLTYLMAIIPGFISVEFISIMTLITAISVIFLYKSG